MKPDTFEITETEMTYVVFKALICMAEAARDNPQGFGILCDDPSKHAVLFKKMAMKSTENYKSEQAKIRKGLADVEAIFS